MGMSLVGFLWVKCHDKRWKMSRGLRLTYMPGGVFFCILRRGVLGDPGVTAGEVS